MPLHAQLQVMSWQSGGKGESANGRGSALGAGHCARAATTFISTWRRRTTRIGGVRAACLIGSGSVSVYKIGYCADCGAYVQRLMDYGVRGLCDACAAKELAALNALAVERDWRVIVTEIVEIALRYEDDADFGTHVRALLDAYGFAVKHKCRPAVSQRRAAGGM